MLKPEFSGQFKQIAKTFDIDDINLIKPGIGEATRVLLRRVPWKILIDERYKGDPQLGHLTFKDFLPVLTRAQLLFGFGFFAAEVG